MTPGQREAPASGDLIEKIGDLTDLRSVVREIKRGAHEIPARVGAQIEDLLRLAALAAASPSPAVPEEPQLPPEPPNQSVLAGDQCDIWHRCDDDENFPGVGRWFTTGDSQEWDWVGAFGCGADPARRLVVVDPTDNAQLWKTAEAIWSGMTPGMPFNYATAAQQGECVNGARAVLRALTEEIPGG